jgi:hypothetical protein
VLANAEVSGSFSVAVYGIILRSKTIEPRLKNCPALKVRGWNDLLGLLFLWCAVASVF